MKPSFALNLSDTAIGLLHRTPHGWQPVGETAIDAPDLDEALGYLRRSALGLAPRGVTTKVVIPNSQILYTAIEAPGPDEDSRRAQIRTALEGQTPYPLDDLVFDWAGDGPVVQVAVVARETLAEAEAFAVTHRFNPVSFVAIPDGAEGAFGGEPWFGPTSLAPSYLQPGETVEPDREPIVVKSRDGLRVEDGTVDATDPTEADDPPSRSLPDETAIDAAPDGASQGAEPGVPDAEADQSDADRGEVRDRREANRAARAARKAGGPMPEAVPEEVQGSSADGVQQDGGTAPESIDGAQGAPDRAGFGADLQEVSDESDTSGRRSGADTQTSAGRSDQVAEVSSGDDLPSSPIGTRASASAVPQETQFDVLGRLNAEPLPRDDRTTSDASARPEGMPTARAGTDWPGAGTLYDPSAAPMVGSGLAVDAGTADVLPGFSGAPVFPEAVDAATPAEAAHPRSGLSPPSDRGKASLDASPVAAPRPEDATFASRRTPPPLAPLGQRSAFVAPVRADAPAIPGAVAERLAARIRAKAAEALPVARPKLARPVPAISGGSMTPVPGPASPAGAAAVPAGLATGSTVGAEGARPAAVPFRAQQIGPPAPLPVQGQTPRPAGAQVTAASIPGTRKKKGPATVAPISAASATATTLKPLTKPGGTFGTKAAGSGTPKYLGLVLTGLLLLVLAIVAAWSTLVLATRDADPATAEASLAAPAVEDEMLADRQDPAAPEMQAGLRDTGQADDAPIVAPPPLNDPAEQVTAEAAVAALPEVDESGSATAVVEVAVPAEDAALADVAAEAPIAEEEAEPAAELVIGPEPTEVGEPEQVTGDAGLAGATLPEGEPALAETDPVSEPPIASEPAPGTVLSTEVQAPTLSDAAQDEIFLAAMDAPPPAPAPPALPVPAQRTDALLAPPPAPPPFGTVYQFDAGGMILPTPEGIVTPEGVRLVAGRPPVVPPPRPVPQATADDAAGAADPAPVADASGEAVAPASGGATPGAILPAASTTIDETIPSDPALANARPRSRPADLTPPPPEATTAGDDASLAVTPNSRVATVRPLPRPEVVLAAAAAARIAAEGASLSRQAAEGASLSRQAEALAEAPTLDPDASLLAVSVSRKPAPRPRDMAGAVEAAVAAAVRAPEPDAVQPAVRQPDPVALAAIAPAVRAPGRTQDRSRDDEPEADEEPEVASAAPRIPTRASVAKQATYANALNLSKVNLIGVYGTPSNRYAMVRQTNGRFKKVEIGDRVDGGTVAAITASELRYQKGGRMMSLKMPKS